MNYELVKEFECNGKEMVIIKTSGAAHVMDKDEWKKVFGKWHPGRWENRECAKGNYRDIV